MFRPPFFGLKLPNALLDFVDESLWYPATPTGLDVVTWGADEGMNLGTIFTVTTNGTVHSLCYYRGYDTMPSYGSIALWNISDYGEVLLAKIDFTGHSGVGWQVMPLDEPLTLTPPEAYELHLWLPAVSLAVTATISYTYFLSNGRFSTPNTFLYAHPANGQTDPRGFVRRNGLRSYGTFARPAVGADYTPNFWIDCIFTARPLYIPPLPPMIMKWDVPEGWPDATNTGPVSGTVFEAPYFEMFNSTYDGQIIENKDLRAGLTIRHPNCIVRNCKVINTSPNVIYMEYGTSDNCLIEDCLVDGVGRYNASVHGITVGSPHCTIQRCNIQRIENGLNVFGQVDCSHVFRDNFIHHLLVSPPVPQPHYDGMQLDGYIVNVLIEHNTVMNEKDDTSAIMLDNLGGPIDNVMVRNNLLCGGGFTCYLDGRLWPIQPITNVSYIDNMLHPGKFGYFFLQGLYEQPTMGGNQHMAHGGIYDAQPPGGFVNGQSVVECMFGYAPNEDAPINGELVDLVTGGLNLGVAFQVSVDGQISSINFRRPGNSSTSDATIGLWRFTGSDLDDGVELLGTRVFTDIIATSVVNFAFETPIDVEAGDNLLAGVFIPRGRDGKVWYFSKHGFFWPDPVPSQWGRYTAFNNSASVPMNGFQGSNGLYAYGPAFAPPLTRGDSDTSYDIDPIFVADWVAETSDGQVNVTSPDMDMAVGDVTVTTTRSVTVEVTGSAMAVGQGGPSVTSAGAVTVAVGGTPMTMAQGTVTALGRRNISTAVTSPAALTLAQGTATATAIARIPVTVPVTSPAIITSRGSVFITAVNATTLGDATNTGVPPGTVLTASGSITTTSVGQIIQNKHVTGTITINHNNCIVRRCLVTTPRVANSKGINCWASNILVEDCEVTTTVGYIAIEGEGVFKRLHVHGWENGFSITGGGTNYGVYNSYVHNMDGIPEGHRDCIQIDGNVNGFVVAYNTLDNQYDETSCVMIDNYWGPINNIDVHDNVMIGGGSYTCYSDGQFAGGPVTNVKFRNNRMDQAQFGYHSFNNNTPVWTNNTDRLTGVLIP